MQTSGGYSSGGRAGRVCTPNIRWQDAEIGHRTQEYERVRKPLGRQQSACTNQESCIKCFDCSGNLQSTCNQSTRLFG